MKLHLIEYNNIILKDEIFNELYYIYKEMNENITILMKILYYLWILKDKKLLEKMNKENRLIENEINYSLNMNNCCVKERKNILNNVKYIPNLSILNLSNIKYENNEIIKLSRYFKFISNITILNMSSILL